MIIKKTVVMIISIFFVYGLYFSQANANIINVPSDQPTIQAGINVAINGDTVLVQPGIFIGNINFNGKNITVGSLFFTTGDTSYISKTVIQGINNGSVVTFANGEDSTAKLCGLTITGGLGSKGGGIFCMNSNSTLTNVRIINNTVYVYGGGLYCSNSSPVLKDVIIMNNRSYEDGGGIYCCENSNPKIRNSIIRNNTSGLYGGGIACYNSNPILDSAIISQNKSLSWHGGGFYCYNSSPLITNVLITKNEVYESVGIGSGGGGICCVENSNPSLSNVTISRNSAKVAGGGIYIDDFSSINLDSINRCNIYLNEAAVGYEIYSWEKKLHIVVDTFTVLKPRFEHAYPIADYTFDILNAKLSQDHSTLFVSPKGDNENSGLTLNEPLKTIGFAKSIINASSQNPATIYLDTGTYSWETNSERFELPMWSYISLKGSGINKTILKGDKDLGILFYHSVIGDTVENLTIMNGGYGLGGGIYCSSSDLVLKNIIIRDCSSRRGGAVYCAFNSNVTLINALLFNNTSSMYGGALYGYHARYNLVNVTITNNTSSQHGSGIYCQSMDINLINSILWNNLPDQVYFDELDNPSSMIVAYSDIEKGQAGILDNGNGSVILIQDTIIDSNPMFENLETGDFHLTNKSMCIGAGIGTVEIDGKWFYSPVEDIENNPRPQPINSMPDLGSFENQLDHPVIVFDNRDMTVNRFMLYQNYPNPFNPVTTIEYNIAEPGNIDLEVYDILGRKVKTIVNEFKITGSYKVLFNAINLPSGIYIYRLMNGNNIQTKSMILLK